MLHEGQGVEASSESTASKEPRSEAGWQTGVWAAVWKQQGGLQKDPKPHLGRKTPRMERNSLHSCREQLGFRVSGVQAYGETGPEPGPALSQGLTLGCVLWSALLSRPRGGASPLESGLLCPLPPGLPGAGPPAAR